MTDSDIIFSNQKDVYPTLVVAYLWRSAFSSVAGANPKPVTRIPVNITSHMKTNEVIVTLVTRLA